MSVDNDGRFVDGGACLAMPHFSRYYRGSFDFNKWYILA